MAADKKRCQGSVYSIALIIILLIILVIYGRPKAAILFYNQGAGFFDKGLYKEAETSFRKSLLLNSQAAITHCALGRVNLKLGFDDEAIKEYTKAVQIDAAYVEAYIALSDIYLKRENYDTAIDWLQRAQEMTPGNQQVKLALEFASFEYMSDCLNKGVDAFLAGEKQRAESLLKTALSLEPNFAYTHYTLAYFYYDQERYSEAETELLKAIGINPEFPFAYKLLGDIYFKRQEYRKVVEVYKNALAQNPSSAILQNDMGLALMQLERYDEAIPYLIEALKLNPGNLNIRYNLASVYRDSKRFDEAIVEYNQLLAGGGDFPNVHNDLGDIYFSKNDKEKAEQEYNKEIANARSRIKNSPEDIIALTNLAHAYNGLGESEEAKKMIDKVITIDPGFREAYLTLGKIQEKTGRLDEAIAAFNKAKTLSIEKNFIDRDISRVEGIKLDKKNILAPDIRTPDILFLNNGRQIQGRIIYESDEKIILEMNMGGPMSEVTFYRSSINRIVRGNKPL